MMQSSVRKRKDLLPVSPPSYKTKGPFSSKSNSLLSFNAIIIIESIIIILLIILTLYYRSNLNTSSANLSLTLNAYQEQQIELNAIKEEFNNGEFNGDINANNELDFARNNREWIKKIQENDYRSLRLQYGEDKPLKIRIVTSIGDIIFEFAAINSMPHTIRYFTNLVSNNYWNGCHFFRNAGHVIQANCHKRVQTNEYNNNNIISLGQESSIIFQEYDYNLEYLHQKYSIGLAGRPGGPDFYINLVDNKRNHGPGGQGPDPDPCFANIIEGFDVVDRIHEMETDGSQMKVLKEWVEFKEITVFQ